MNFDVLRIHQSVPYVKCLAALFDACLELAVFVCLPQSSANAQHPAPLNRDAGWLAGGMLCESQFVKRGFIPSGIANDFWCFATHRSRTKENPFSGGWKAVGIYKAK